LPDRQTKLSLLCCERPSKPARRVFPECSRRRQCSVRWQLMFIISPSVYALLYTSKCGNRTCTNSRRHVDSRATAYIGKPCVVGFQNQSPSLTLWKHAGHAAVARIFARYRSIPLETRKTNSRGACAEQSGL